MYINLRFLDPKKTGEIGAADVLDLDLDLDRDLDLQDRKWDLIHHGRKCAFWYGYTVHNTHLHIDKSKKYSFHSYRRSAATAIADGGGTFQKDFPKRQLPKSVLVAENV